LNAGQEGVDEKATQILFQSDPVQFQVIETATIKTSALTSEGTVSPAEQEVEKGQSATISAEAKGGYKFQGWKRGGNLIPDSATSSFTLDSVQESFTITASFERVSGRLKVIIRDPKPPTAQWRRSVNPETNWWNSEVEEDNIGTGTYALEINPVDGWAIITPTPTVTVNEGYNEVSGQYYIDSTPPVITLSPSIGTQVKKNHEVVVHFQTLKHKHLRMRRLYGQRTLPHPQIPLRLIRDR
jgi:hypothetical protein